MLTTQKTNLNGEQQYQKVAAFLKKVERPVNQRLELYEITDFTSEVCPGILQNMHGDPEYDEQLLTARCMELNLR